MSATVGVVAYAVGVRPRRGGGSRLSRPRRLSTSVLSRPVTKQSIWRAEIGSRSAWQSAALMMQGGRSSTRIRRNSIREPPRGAFQGCVHVGQRPRARRALKRKRRGLVVSRPRLPSRTALDARQRAGAMSACRRAPCRSARRPCPSRVQPSHVAQRHVRFVFSAEPVDRLATGQDPHRVRELLDRAAADDLVVVLEGLGDQVDGPREGEHDVWRWTLPRASR